MIARLLIEKGADALAVNEGGQTPRHFAVQNGHQTVSQLLISKVADLSDAGMERSATARCRRRLQRSLVEASTPPLRRRNTCPRLAVSVPD